jgi:FixJ family two-component response regulator
VRELPKLWVCSKESKTRRSHTLYDRIYRSAPPPAGAGQVAGELGITDMTVKTHRGRVMRKMGAGSLADLVPMAEKRKISHQSGVRPK